MKITKQNLLLIGSIATLALTTLYWSFLSATIHQQNSDQLADPMLFDNWSTFSQSVFPSQHTFLLKWPLFFAVQAWHATPMAYVTFTVLLSLVTVGLFGWILSRIEKRPHVLALLFLAMSSVLLLVPIEPTPASLLPVGMGMLATRNIEYIVFLSAIILLLRQSKKSFLTRYTVGAGALLLLLFVSDKLFVGLFFGGSILLLGGALFCKNKHLQKKAMKILLTGIIAVIISGIVFILLHNLGITDSPANAAGPYGIELSPKNIISGIIYGFMGVLAQFGANSVSETVIIKDLPAAAVNSLLHPSFIAHLINTGILLASAYSAVLLVKKTFKKSPLKLKKKDELARTLSYFGTFTILAAIVSIALFIVTKHYYAVDARYMGLVFFAGFIALAIQVSTMKFEHRFVLNTAIVLIIGSICGIFGVTQSFNASLQAYSSTDSENNLVAQVLRHHHIDTLAADYWRVYPIINKTSSNINPVALDTCFGPREVLTSRQWQQNAYKKSFAYLLTTETTGTGYPSCTLAAVRATFGSPTDTLIVKGTAKNPETMLLFYDRGVEPYKPKTIIRPNDNSLIRNLDDLKDTACESGRTVLQTVAHQDDDILFMNPDMLEGVKNGDCVHTIYFTAGDAGADQVYWLSREEGAKAGYERLFGVSGPVWRSRDVLLSENHQVKISRSTSTLIHASLIFLRLPDGNVDGSGFKSDSAESLSKLSQGLIPTISSVDKTSRYTKADIIAAIHQLMEHYRPSVVRTQATQNHGKRFSDHSDHLAVGQLTQDAFVQYQVDHPEASIQHYIGYPVRGLPVNVEGDDLLTKKSIFFSYADHDPSTCISDASCEKTSYSFYLNRQYTE